MTVRDAAMRLEISQSLAYRLIAERRLSCIRIGGQGRRGKIIVTEDDIRRFMERTRAEHAQ